MKAVLRAGRIGRVILRYRLDDLLQGTPAERWLRLAKPFVPRASAGIAAQSRGARLERPHRDLSCNDGPEGSDGRLNYGRSGH